MPIDGRKLHHASMTMLPKDGVQRGDKGVLDEVTGMTSVEQDLRNGVPRLEMASRHREFLMHWDEKKLAAAMAMLRDAHIGPFTQLPAER
ncbi:MAG: hypothetical protein ABI884_13120 [Gemmatimonadota bacterium]